MKKKEDCSWCMSTQHIIRDAPPPFPPEFASRCSACHEEWGDENRECDFCESWIDTENDEFVYNEKEHTYKCTKH